MIPRSRRAEIAALVGVFLMAFALRAYQPLSRPSQWLERSQKFNQAVDARDWASTYQQYHPGFTTMLISGTTLRLYDAVKGTPAEALMSWAIPPYATPYGQRMVAGVMGLALVIAGLIVGTSLSLHRLAGWPLALAAAGLLTFSPLFLSEGRALHLDGLVSALMLLSALLLLVNLESGRRRYLVLSGLMGGLALLTKTPALFLLPYTGLALLAHLVRRLRAAWSEHSTHRTCWLLGETWRALVWPGLLWLLMAALPFALWPAMWVQPVDVVQQIFNSINSQIGKGHKGRFFAGQIYHKKQPPVLFYPVAMVFKSSFLTLTLALVALGHYTLWRKRGRLPLQPITFWLLVAYVFFFTLQMAIGAHQDFRYILPGSTMLEVLAAIGLAGLVELLGQATAGGSARLTRALPASLVGAAVALQALIALPYAPDYGAHHNQLLGGNRVAVKMVEIASQNEGISYVADYLSRQPDVASLQVGVANPLERSMEQYFPGRIALSMTAKDDYHLFSVMNLQRQLQLGRWQHAWESHKGEIPQVLVVIDGVEYMWLYATQPPIPYEPIVIRHGGGIGFIVLAWVWTAALGAALVWSLRRVENYQSSGETP